MSHNNIYVHILSCISPKNKSNFNLLSLNKLLNLINSTYKSYILLLKNRPNRLTCSDFSNQINMISLSTRNHLSNMRSIYLKTFVNKLNMWLSMWVLSLIGVGCYGKFDFIIYIKKNYFKPFSCYIHCIYMHNRPSIIQLCLLHCNLSMLLYSKWTNYPDIQLILQAMDFLYFKYDNLRLWPWYKWW